MDSTAQHRKAVETRPHTHPARRSQAPDRHDANSTAAMRNQASLRGSCERRAASGDGDGDGGSMAMVMTLETGARSGLWTVAFGRSRNSQLAT